MKQITPYETEHVVNDFEQAWMSERPDLNPAAVGTDLRLNLAAQLFSERCVESLMEHDLEWWEYDVLSRLRREGSPYKCSVQELADILPVSSGALTNRLDKLEQRSLITRTQDKADRRRVIVKLKPEGRKRVDTAAEARFDAASRTLGVLNIDERMSLNRLLDKLLVCNQPLTEDQDN
jgi:DNA-binding MarR family transcriptional regulator